MAGHRGIWTRSRCRLSTLDLIFYSSLPSAYMSRVFLNIFILSIFLDIGVPQVASVIIPPRPSSVTDSHSEMTSTLTTASCTTPLSYTSPAFPIDVMANLNHTTLPPKENLTVVSGNIISMVSKLEDEASASAGTNTSNSSAIEKSNVTTRNEYLKPSFFYSEPLRISCSATNNNLVRFFNRQMRSILSGEKDAELASLGLSPGEIKLGIRPFKRQYEMFLKRGGGLPPPNMQDVHLRKYLWRRRLWECRSDDGCICDQDTGKIVMPQYRGEGSHCRKSINVAACVIIFDFPVIPDDFKHAINEIPDSVLLSPENSGWFWTVPPEITDGEEVTIRPGDPVPPRTNIAPAGEPPFWLYGTPRNPPELRLPLSLPDDGQLGEPEPSTHTGSQSDFRVDPGRLPGLFTHYPSNLFEYDDRYQY
ncbi:hypothetical protein TWF128_011735 [Orbilia oligospora]|nr:hypothetical protein TWF128_011735 [Orbilia oligospora]